jgi:hypothetical protein
VAELVDATGLGPVGCKPLEVRVLSPAYLNKVILAAVRVQDQSVVMVETKKLCCSEDRTWGGSAGNKYVSVVEEGSCRCLAG